VEYLNRDYLTRQATSPCHGI